MSPHMFTESVNYWMPLVAVGLASTVCFGMITLFLITHKQAEQKATKAE